jgi:hypothetical protein
MTWTRRVIFERPGIGTSEEYVEADAVGAEKSSSPPVSK